MTFPSVIVAIEFAIADVEHTLAELAKPGSNKPRLIQRFRDKKRRYIFDLIQLVCRMLPKLNQQQVKVIKGKLARFIQLADKPK